MKRMNVVVDEELLERARRLTGERTYSGTIARALEEAVREARFRELLVEWEKLAAERPIFREGYLEEIRPKGDTVVARRYSANEKRVARKSRGRDSR